MDDNPLVRAAAAEVFDNERGALPRELRTHLHEQSDMQRAGVLWKLLQPVVGKSFRGRERKVLEKVDAITRRYVEFLARHGIAFPQLRAIVFFERGHIDLVRADLDDGGIQQCVRNAIQRFPDITGRELAQAIRGAFPDYRGVQNQVIEENIRRKAEIETR
jgi:hypothetical protein